MKKLATLICALCLLAGLSGSGQAFQEYPSIEIVPYVGYLLYDSELTSYMSNLNYGFRVDLRTTPLLGFQFNYSRASMKGDFPGQPFGKNYYIERVQLNLTRDLVLYRGVFFSGFAGIGSFNRHTSTVYDNDFSVQGGLSARRNLFDWLYLRGDAGWTGAWLKDYGDDAQFSDRTLTNHFDFALTLSVLLDN
jgi:hypothetical protein